MAPDDLVLLGTLVVAAAFLPPLLWLLVTRNVERHDREPWGGVFRAFFYGAIVSVLIAIIISTLFQTNFAREYNIPSRNGQFTVTPTLIMVIVVAPLVEEFSKGLGVRGARPRIRELEDGIVYGVAAGLGFSATENLIYEIAALVQDPQGYTFLLVALVRSVTSTFLHATATGILGYGMGKRYLEGGMFIELLPYYALAVLLHAAFNALATLQTVAGVPLLGIAFIVVVSIVAIRWTLDRIRRLDAQSAPAAYR